ncbi:putative ankyrin repeat protein [Chlorella vulgaris]
MLAATAIRPPPIAASLSRARCKVAARPGLFTLDSFRGNLLRRVPASKALSMGVSHQHKRCILAASTGRYYEFDPQGSDGPSHLVSEDDFDVLIVLMGLNRLAAKNQTFDEAATSALPDVAAQYPLHDAVLTARTAEAAEATIKQLLAAGHPVDQPDDKGNRPLHLAVMNSSSEAAAAAIRLLVAAGADVAARDGSGNEALHLAILNAYILHQLKSRTDRTRRSQFWEMDYNYDYDFDYEYSVFDHELAESEANSDIAQTVRALLDATGMAWSHFTWPPSRSTTAAEAEAIISFLLNAGADVCGGGEEYDIQPIHLAAMNPSPGAASAAIRLLCAAGADPEAEEGDGEHDDIRLPLHNAVRNTNPTAAAAAVTALLKAGADVDGQTLRALHAAAGGCGDANVIEAVIPLLLGAGQDVDGWNGQQSTALHAAAANKNLDAAQAAISLLVAADADINARTYDGRQPLHIAAACSSSAHVVALLARGADVQAQCKDGLTPLHYAALHNCDNAVDCINALLAAGADVAAVTCYGQQPIHLAVVNEIWHAEKEVTAITALLQAGANVNAKDAEGGQSPLHYATMAFFSEGATAAIKRLLAAGADVNALDTNNICPLGFAQHNQHAAARIAAATALWKAGGRYSGFDDDTQQFFGPANLAAITGFLGALTQEEEKQRSDVLQAIARMDSVRHMYFTKYGRLAEQW